MFLIKNVLFSHDHKGISKSHHKLGSVFKIFDLTLLCSSFVNLDFHTMFLPAFLATGSFCKTFDETLCLLFCVGGLSGIQLVVLLYCGHIFESLPFDTALLLPFFFNASFYSFWLNDFKF